MSEDKTEGCVQPAGGPILKSPESHQTEKMQNDPQNGGRIMNVTVGKEAPDFTATAYHNGQFKNIQLSDYRGKWVFLCFYPGDFTFV